MSESTSRFREIFFEVFEQLPRQGPGNRSSAARAIGLCRELPASPTILDLGCGAGGQTFQLAELLAAATILAVDSHAPSIARLDQAIAQRRLSHHVRAIVGDMAHSLQTAESFDLVWSEGALYSIGLRSALHVCHNLLRPGGYIAYTDAIWRKENPPADVRALFETDYPTMGSRDDGLATLRDCGFELIGHFTLPEEAWWDDFYTPMETCIEQLRLKYVQDAEALTLLDQIADEPEMHRRYSEFYAYEFFVARRPVACPGP